MLKSMLMFFMISSLFLFNAGCGNGGVTLAGDRVESSKCPPGGCAGSAPDVTQLSITSPAGTTMYVPILKNSSLQVVDSVEIGGDCYTSTYPNNRIEVELYAGNSRIISLDSDIVNTRRDYSIASASSDSLPRCYLGRYGFAIKGSLMPDVRQYNIRVSIIGIDEKGTQFRNEGTGVYRLNIARQ